MNQYPFHFTTDIPENPGLTSQTDPPTFALDNTDTLELNNLDLEAKLILDDVDELEFSLDNVPMAEVD